MAKASVSNPRIKKTVQNKLFFLCCSSLLIKLCSIPFVLNEMFEFTLYTITYGTHWKPIATIERLVFI